MSLSPIYCNLHRCDPLTHKSSSGVVIAPSTSVLAPLKGGNQAWRVCCLDLENSCIRLAESREPWSTTSPYPSSLVGGIRELSNAGGIRCLVEYLHFISSEDGGVSGGLGTSRRRHVIQGSDTSSRPLTGTGAQHITLLPPDRVTTSPVVADYQGTIPSL